MDCEHPRMISTVRTDKCPDCGYEFYYGDAHATGEAQLSKLVNPGRKKETKDYHNDPWIDIGGEG